MTQQRLKTQVLVIGAGISGSTSALTLADAGYEVTLIVPGKELDGGNSALAQGGIVYRSDPNDAKDLEKDILIAGHHHNYVKAVRHLCQHGPEAVERILMERAPIPFDRLDGKLDFTREGGHGKHRIVHCADHTGKTIMEGLLQAVRMSPNIRILTGRTAVDLITTDHHARYKEYRYQLDNQCLGAYVYNEDTREVETLLADFTVLATGGVGQVYLHTTNTAACTGSGIAMAQRAGVRLDNLEYVQFHPTALYTRQSHSFLITEAMRGEGARLTNAKGEFFMKRYDERADLAPRDIVARAIMDEMLHSGEPCMYLDVSGVKHDIPTRFPTIYQHCMELGIDINKKPIPVVPVAHFFCGGILVDASARTTLTPPLQRGRVQLHRPARGQPPRQHVAPRSPALGLQRRSGHRAAHHQARLHQQAPCRRHPRLGKHRRRAQRRPGAHRAGLGDHPQYHVELCGHQPHGQPPAPCL